MKMQPRTLKYAMTEEEVDALLAAAPVGRLGVVDENGPYVLPLHFACHGGAVYFHGRGEGRKTDAILKNASVCFEVDEMANLVMPEKGDNPCSVGTKYQSVIIRGRAFLVEDMAEKRLALEKIVAKYTPGLDPSAMPDAAVAATMVVRIDVLFRTGKYHP